MSQAQPAQQQDSLAAPSSGARSSRFAVRTVQPEPITVSAVSSPSPSSVNASAATTPVAPAGKVGRFTITTLPTASSDGSADALASSVPVTPCTPAANALPPAAGPNGARSSRFQVSDVVPTRAEASKPAASAAHPQDKAPSGTAEDTTAAASTATAAAAATTTTTIAVAAAAGAAHAPPKQEAGQSAGPAHPKSRFTVTSVTAAPATLAASSSTPSAPPPVAARALSGPGAPGAPPLLVVPANDESPLTHSRSVPLPTGVGEGENSTSDRPVRHSRFTVRTLSPAHLQADAPHSPTLSPSSPTTPASAQQALSPALSSTTATIGTPATPPTRSRFHVVTLHGPVPTHPDLAPSSAGPAISSVGPTEKKSRFAVTTLGSASALTSATVAAPTLPTAAAPGPSRFTVTTVTTPGEGASAPTTLSATAAAAPKSSRFAVKSLTVSGQQSDPDAMTLQLRHAGITIAPPSPGASPARSGSATGSPAQASLGSSSPRALVDGARLSVVSASGAASPLHHQTHISAV